MVRWKNHNPDGEKMLHVCILGGKEKTKRAKPAQNPPLILHTNKQQIGKGNQS